MKNDRLLLLVDLEGIIGFSGENSFQQNWELARAEMDSLLGALQTRGEQKLSVCVIHNDGSGFPEQFLSQRDLRLFESAGHLTESVQDVRCAILIGFHGMRDTGGCFDHSFRMDFVDLEYDGLRLGEVGIFTRWLAGQGIPTLLVSGEGNFSKELGGIDCVIHRVPPYLKEADELERVRRELADAALSALQSRDWPHLAGYAGKGPLTVRVDNPDKYLLLKDLPNADVRDDRFVFPDLNIFIANLYPFCLRLNQAIGQIAEKNIRLAKRLRESVSEETLRRQLGPYLRRDFLTFSGTNRRMISEKVGIAYEDD